MKDFLQLRTPEEVFKSHLGLRKQGKTEEDIKANYAEDVIVVSNWGTFFGHDGVRESARILSEHLPNATFEYDIDLTEKQVGFLVWSSESSNGLTVRNGVDSFIIKNGKIVVQTIYYTLE